MLFRSRHYILIYYLAISLHPSICANVGSFQKPSTNSDARIIELQNNLIKVQTEIVGLSTSLALGDKSSDLKVRLTTLEGSFENLKQQLVDERRESSASNGKYDGAIASLTIYYNSLNTQLKALQTTMENQIEAEAERRGPSDIADEIKSRNFVKAETLLLKMNDNTKIAKIVHDVYANSEGNAVILLDFAKALTKIDISFHVLSSLRYEMRANGHRDPYKLMDVVKALEKEVINQKNGAAEIKDKAREIVSQTVADITDIATEILKTAMYSDSYQKNVNVEKLANQIDDFQSDVSDDVMGRVVNDIYPTVSAVKIADNIYSNKYIPQIVWGLVVLYRKLENANDLNNKAIFSIADYLKRLRNMKNYANLSESKKLAVNSVIEKMPTCARNLFFSEIVCFWNKGQLEYLYAASDQFKWNRDRRNVFTWYPGERVLQGYWYVEKFGDQFYFKNTAHSNESLYVGIHVFNKDRRHVFTWVDGGHLGNKSAWNVELAGDYCYLRNEHFNEYLYASSEMHSGYRRYVFTWVPGTSTQQADFQWQIRNCS